MEGIKMRVSMNTSINLEVDVEISGYLTPYRPARTNCAIENSYPEEGGYCEDVEVFMVRDERVKQKDGSFKTEKIRVDITEFLTEEQLDIIYTDLYEEGSRIEQDRIGDAADAKYQEMKDER